MTITYTRKFAAILCLVIPSIVGLVTFSASAAEPAKKEAVCPAGKKLVLVAKASIVNEDGSIRVISRSICVTK